MSLPALPKHLDFLQAAAHTFAFTCEYDGNGFSGFQFQPDSPTIQGELEKAFSTYLRAQVRICGAGRTDAGVHACNQVCSFAFADSFPDFENRSSSIIKSVNAILPRSIAIKELFRVPENFHPRFSCLARAYEYRIWNSPQRAVFLTGKSLWVRHSLAVETINQELQALVGEHDFSAFTRAEYALETTERYIDSISMARDDLEPLLLIFQIRGNAFLHNMIRIIIGTVIDRARGKIKDSLAEILESKDRRRAGHTAGPDGLFFKQAFYPPDLARGLPLAALENYPVFRRSVNKEAIEQLNN